jgi:hypothetical protein
MGNVGGSAAGEGLLQQRGRLLRVASRPLGQAERGQRRGKSRGVVQFAPYVEAAPKEYARLFRVTLPTGQDADLSERNGPLGRKRGRRRHPVGQVEHPL